MKNNSFTQLFLFVSGSLLLLAGSVFGQQAEVAVKNDANLYLTNNEGEKVFSYNNKREVK